MQTIDQGSPARQAFGAESDFSPLNSLIHDLRQFRDHSIGKEKRRRSAVLAGQLLILAREYQNGRRPNRRTLKRFFYFVAREAA